MIRTVLASPWLPLLYWAAAVIAMVCSAGQVSLKRRLGHHEFKSAVSASVRTPAQIQYLSSAHQPQPAKQANEVVCKPTRFWYAQISVVRRPNTSVQGFVKEVITNSRPISGGARTSVSEPITMLTIRVDASQQTTASTLAIQCRTSLTIDNEHGRTVTVQGVVTQEVVSSTGKILIMAGSRVVGSGLLDPENGRFKSDGQWSIFFDDTELKVQARLLDRPAGLPGILGQETSNEVGALQREAVKRDGRCIFVPRNAPFVLELHGEILLRDLKSDEANG